MSTLTEQEWNTLVFEIKHNECTPFLGAGVCEGILPLTKEIARQLAANYKYPFDNCEDLIQVAQYCKTTSGSTNRIKHDICEIINNSLRAKRDMSDFGNLYKPHRTLASLQFPIYITTNYDTLMLAALTDEGKRPRQVVCQWSNFNNDSNPASSPSSEKLLTEEPVVFHLHGNIKTPESMVVTEDDYIDFLVNIVREQHGAENRIIPTYIQKAIAKTSLLYIGYSLTDWNFKVILRCLLKTVDVSHIHRHITVQLPPSGFEQSKCSEQKDYLKQHFDNFGNARIRVYWGTAKDFCEDLDRRFRSQI